MTVSSSACPSAPAGESMCSSSRRGRSGSSSGCRYGGGSVGISSFLLGSETCSPDARIGFHGQLVLTRQACGGASGCPGWPFRGCVCVSGAGVVSGGELPESRRCGWALSAFQGVEFPGRQTSDFQARLSAPRASGLRLPVSQAPWRVVRTLGQKRGRPCVVSKAASSLGSSEPGRPGGVLGSL